ncbi:phage tail assembly chaperone G [Schleiferilactobacillus perolens]|nr:hypothetical protein [Schleiferilactobacillus perolens]
MVHEITLDINNKPAKFVRNDEPHLADITNGLKLQQQRLQMWGKPEGPSENDFDVNEKLLAQFAVDFWHGQFTLDDIINGATSAAVDAINAAIADTMQYNTSTDAKDDGKNPKKSPAKTTKRRLKTSNASMPPVSKTVTSSLR